MRKAAALALLITGFALIARGHAVPGAHAAHHHQAGRTVTIIAGGPEKLESGARRERSVYVFGHSESPVSSSSELLGDPPVIILELEPDVAVEALRRGLGTHPRPPPVNR